MSEKLGELIMGDHRKLQEMAAELRTECAKRDASEGECFLRFRLLKALFSAQAKAKEFTLYAALEEDVRVHGSELHSLVFEGYEEHDLAEMILKEMGQAEELSPQWCSKLKVFSELLAHQIEKEESQFLPGAMEAVGPERLKEMCEEYVHEREEIFAKKSGLKPPPLPSYATNNLTH